MSEPAGIVMPFAGSVAPQGYLICDGSAVSRSTYSALFTAIGTVYGTGDGSTTFNIPDLSGRVVIGVSNSHALGSTGGEATHVLTSSELPAHVHEVPIHGHGNDITATTPSLSHSITQPAFKYNKPNGTSVTTFVRNTHWGYTGSGATNASRSTNAAVAAHEATACTVTGSVSDCDTMVTSAVGTGVGHNNLQPYQAIAYIICTGVE